MTLTFDELRAQIKAVEAKQASGRNKAEAAIGRASAHLAMLDAKLDPYKTALEDLVTTRSKLLTPWTQSGTKGRNVSRYLFDPTRPIDRTWGCRAWVRAMGSDAWTRGAFIAGQNTWTWTADIHPDREHPFKRLQTTPETDLSGWEALLAMTDAELVARGFILLNTPEEVATATRTYWPTTVTP